MRFAIVVGPLLSSDGDCVSQGCVQLSVTTKTGHKTPTSSKPYSAYNLRAEGTCENDTTRSKQQAVLYNPTDRPYIEQVVQNDYLHLQRKRISSQHRSVCVKFSTPPFFFKSYF